MKQLPYFVFINILLSSVKLVKSAVNYEGVVTEWRPSQLMGLIYFGDKGETITVRRQNFVAGGNIFNSAFLAEL